MELVYKKAGHVELVRYSDSKRFLKNGVVSSVASKITNKTNTLPDGNKIFDLTFSAGKAGQVVVNFSSFQPALYAALTSATFTEGATVAVRKIEETTIPATAPLTVTLAKTPVTDTVVIHNEDDSPFVKVASGPTSGQFSVSGSTVTFASDNAEDEVIIAYDTSVTGKQMELSEEAENDTFRLTVAGEASVRKNEGTKKIDSITFDKVMPTGDISKPTTQKEPQGWSVTFDLQPPRPGYMAVDYVVEE